MKLRALLPLALATTVSLVLGVTVVLALARADRDLPLRIEPRLRQRLFVMQGAVEAAFQRNDDGDVALALAEHAADPTLELGLVLRADGVVVASTRRELIGLPVTELAAQPALARCESCGALPGLVERARASDLALVLTSASGTEVVGLVDAHPRRALRFQSAERILVLVEDLDTTRRTYRDTALRVVAAAALVLLLGAAAFGLVLDRLVFRRVGRVLASARRLAAGDSASRSGVGGPDELGRLGAAFDEMAAALERERAALQVSHEGWRLLFELAVEPIFVQAPDGRFTLVNAAGLTLVGRSLEELQRMTPHDLVSEEEQRARPIELDRVGRDGPERVRRQLRHGDGSLIPVEVTARRLPDGRLLARCVDLRPVIEAESMRERLQLSERLASVGTLAAGVAHEINNPLAYVRSNLDYVLDWLSEDERPAAKEPRDALWEAREGAERIVAIVQDLRLFSRAPEERFAPVDLRGVLERTCSLVAPTARHQARIERRLSEVPLIEGSEGRLGQLFLNLLVNGLQAMPEGRAAEENHVVVLLEQRGERLCVEITDNGVGMTPEIERRLFDPFFTTKPAGVGTGMGLSISRGIVEAHGGTIRVTSAPGTGTTFTVELPLPAR